MTQFRIVPVSKAQATAIRLTRRDNFGHPVIEQIATGKGPCRVSLKPFVKGVEKRLLFSHTPFAIDNAYNQPGPVFINSEEVEEYADVHRFPPEIKADKKSFPLTLIGYTSDQRMVYTQLVGDHDVDELIRTAFDSRSDIDYLHARNAEAGCFICKIVRV